MGYHLHLIKPGVSIGYRDEERFPSASTIKTAVMVDAINRIDEGTLKMTDKQPVPSDPSRREASMWAYYLKEGTALDLDAWLNLMITVSDNTATIVTRDWLGTMNVNARMEKLGLKNTKILGNYPPDNLSMKRLRGQFGMGMTTPKEMAKLLQLIYEKKAASPEGCEKMIRILSHQYWDDWIGSSAPVDIKVASKSGAITRSRSDTAIVFSTNQPYILTIYTDNQKDRRWTGENEGDQTIQKMAAIVWNELNPGRPYRVSTEYKTKYLPTGGGVE